MWVFVSHALILVGGPALPVLSYGELAVDLFMMLSGFLMAHHFFVRESKEPWNQASTWRRFWMRRWLRIAPLYFLLLLVALLAGPSLGDCREAIAAVWHSATTPLARYSDHSLDNVLMHLSFLFGLFPAYTFATPLPDWSLGLEMQFYLAFPLLMLMMRGRYLHVGVLLVLACEALQWGAHDWFNSYDMPSFLPMKLYVFVIGIWLAAAQHDKAALDLRHVLAVALLFVAWKFLQRPEGETLMRLLMVAGFAFVIAPASQVSSRTSSQASQRSGQRLRLWIQGALSSRAARFAGDTSYALYLVHLLVLIPVAAWLAADPDYVALPLALRLVVLTGLCALIAYPVAWLLYHVVERPGIALGRRRFQARPNLELKART